MQKVRIYYSEEDQLELFAITFCVPMTNKEHLFYIFNKIFEKYFMYLCIKINGKVLLVCYLHKVVKT